MGSMGLGSAFQVDKGRNEGFLCHRCSWGGRSISTRLMSLAELTKHAATEHRIPPQSMDLFVSKAPYETRGEFKGNLIGDPTMGNQNIDTFWRIQPYSAKPRGKLQDAFPDMTIVNQHDSWVAKTSHGSGCTPAIRNPLQNFGQKPIPQEYPQEEYSKHLSSFTSESPITGSQGNTTLTSSSTNIQIRKPQPQICRIPSTNSAIIDFETNVERLADVTSRPHSVCLPDRSSICHGAMSENLQDEENGEGDKYAAVWEGADSLHRPIANLNFSAVASADQNSPFDNSNRDPDSNRHENSNDGSQPKHKSTYNSEQAPSFCSVPGFRQILQNRRTASLHPTAQSKNMQSSLQEHACITMNQQPSTSRADVHQSLQNHQTVNPSLEIQTEAIPAILPKSKGVHYIKDSPSDYTESNDVRSQNLHQIVSNPRAIDLANQLLPDRTSSSLPIIPRFAMDEPDNVLGSPFGSARNDARTTSNRHNRKRRKFSEDPIPRPSSRRQTERPAPRSDKPSKVDTIFCSADEVPHRTDIQYRQWLTDYAPDVPHHDLTYESFKAKFDRSKDKSIYMHLASERFLKERRMRLNEYEQITMDHDILIGNLAKIEQINYVNAHRSELVSLMAQRVIQELSAEEKLDDEQHPENTRIELEQNKDDLMPGPRPPQFVAPHGDPLDSETIPGRYQILLPNGELFDHTADGAMPENWEDAAKLLLGEEDSDGVESVMHEDGLFLNGDIPQDDQFFDFEAASAPWSLPRFGGEEEDFNLVELGEL